MLFIYQSRRKFFKIEDGCSSSFCNSLKDEKGQDFCLWNFHVSNAISKEDAESHLKRLPKGCIFTIEQLEATILQRFPQVQPPTS